MIGWYTRSIVWCNKFLKDLLKEYVPLDLDLTRWWVVNDFQNKEWVVWVVSHIIQVNKCTEHIHYTDESGFATFHK
jgi:hypothetical protein